MAEVKRAYDVVTLQASATKTADGSGTAVRLPGFAQNINGITFTLDVTAAATAAADTLDAFVQTKVDGTNWIDVVAFVECAGNGGAKRYVDKLSATAAQTDFDAGAALGAGNHRQVFGDEWRARWVIANDTAPSYTFSVSACPG